MGVHVINSQDIENHFGTSEPKESLQPATNRPKADIHLHMDAQVCQEAQTAADANMELSKKSRRR